MTSVVYDFFAWREQCMPQKSHTCDNRKQKLYHLNWPKGIIDISFNQYLAIIYLCCKMLQDVAAVVI